MAIPLLTLPVTQPMPKPATHPVMAHRESRSVPAPIKTTSPEPTEIASTPIPTPTPSPTPEARETPVKQVSTIDTGGVNCKTGAGDPKSFIYTCESGNDPAKWNTSGCLGLGQACPASKLLAVCPNTDYACEDQYFTGYMIARYHTWEAAKAFWLARTPINGRDVGNWW
jgi:hypothetical protein